MIEQRLYFSELSPVTYKALVNASMSLDKSSLPKALIELIFMRVSQINGCAFCLNMHGKFLRESGFDDAKMDTIAGWRLSHAFSEAERAALEWAEAVTNITTSGTPDSTFNALKTHFTDAEISDLTFAISIMNAFNRLAVSLRQ
ncbi:carboxymuconolactone decarboxylase family protein [Yersinia alsatica]|uniref:Carboxymuconolactone decarboxylase family protein n=1 Tax=Yersinia alsatica TaxID=2890317 RepID=A0ABY5UTF6_9GAMM|nr:carboxymuconolactone decarboxylase family protein [Yersinia alsatica]OVZ91370.1 carboxymuconolactone decarboxylase family protein [Yersinia frederiksenii]OWF67745.1 carboxymuconolactone decarboxylase family protein [Yersinia frederiksenii]OWF80361.1 carboxymuconolactone decarboxylase family protein [Yersinia frederiksenii]UWM46778.1 carboxymuconolactone decarboxylase family protein [Yersinia alsatica]CFQ56481.1 4-carboxymuconolactone decarboxylase [Yersinia frederiksenii]